MHDQAKRTEAAKNNKKRPPVVVDVINMAAKCIQAQSAEYNKWTSFNYEDNDDMYQRIVGSSLYIQVGSTSNLMKKFM